jgi:hypothetical protein
MSKLLAVLAFILWFSATASAGDNPEIAIALHIQDYYEPCGTFRLPDCFAIQTQHPAPGEIFVYVLICGHGWTGRGFMAARYGITWPAEWGPALGWWSCSDMVIGSIHEPGDYVDQFWHVCQEPRGFPELAGILQLEAPSPGRVEVIVHGESGTAEVGDCYAGTDIVLPCDLGNGRAGWVTVIGRIPGCNPCPCVGPPCHLPPSANERDTWGTIKALYR